MSDLTWSCFRCRRTSYAVVPRSTQEVDVSLRTVIVLLPVGASGRGEGHVGGGGVTGAVTVTEVRTVFACRGLPESPTTSTNVFVPALLPQECELPLLAALPSTAAE